MSKYNHTNLLEFRQEIANALGDPEMVFWNSTEIDLLIEQALLTFGAISGFWKDKFLLTCVDNQQIYDIFTDVTDTTKLAPSFTYQKVIDWISKEVIETIPSELLTTQDLLDLIEARYSKYQLLTGLVLGRDEINITTQQNLYTLNDDIIDLVRLKVIDSEENSNVLMRSDELELQYFTEASLLIEKLPEFYSTIYGSPNEVKLYPIPSNNGILYIIAVFGQDTITAVTVNTIINLPNNLVPYIKFGVEADIHNKEGLLNSPSKARYCEDRWNEGVFVGKNYTSMLSVNVNGRPILTDSLFSLDLHNIAIRTRNPPSILGLAGFNIFELDTIPADDQHSIDFISQHNAPIPLDDEDKIDIEIGYIDSLLAYVLHLAQLKTGVLDKTMAAKNGLIQLALAHNERLQLKGISFENIVGKTKLEEVDQPKIPVMENG